MQLRALITLVLLCLLPLNAADAKPAYRVDGDVAACKTRIKSGENIVLALSPTGISYCVYGKFSLENQRATALKRCNASVPASLRGVAPCEVVMENDKITAKDSLRLLQRDIATPVQITLTDAATGTTTSEAGLLITGQSLGPNVVAITMTGKGGKILCRGKQKLSGAGAGFDVTCGEFRFVGRNAPLTGVMVHKGNYVGIFSVKFAYKAASMEVRTLTPKGTKIYR